MTMHKTAIQFITLLLTIALGFAGGYYYCNSKSGKLSPHTEENKTLETKVDSLLLVIDGRGVIIAAKDSIAKIDSVHITKILDRIKSNEAALRHERDRVNKLSTDEKILWMYTYYGIKH